VKVIIAGGGTAGHVFPAIALAQRLSKRGVQVHFTGTSRGLETELVPAAGFELTTMDIRPFPRKISWDLVRAPLALYRAIKTSRPVVRDADIVVGMGGYASAPAVLAAFRAKIPVVLHEQNAIPGAANRYLSRRARAVALSFEEAGGSFPTRVRTVVTGNPIREQVAEIGRGRERLRSEAFDVLGLDPSRRTIVVFGGSQGALHVDIVAAETCTQMSGRAELQVLLLTGRAHLERITALLHADMALKVAVLPFLDRMELAYSVADLVVSRAGATSIAETTVCGLPALLIPYPHATGNHQEANARALERVGAAEVILDADLSPRLLTDRVEGLLDDAVRLEAMAAAAAAWGRPDAAALLADVAIGEAGR
jgi:UDP-N-acetylglucosamine--N-acetylmuramyl-(pentapeptide) pyrophosphoryl-undecaprenol N-acetylglucosamine transferase